ncbi:hypothetical protein ACH4E5_35765 [Streptomyces afghaniensis]|uniref:hypothetical protein n=1 Tax=Streptomyces afghaniensis TaxID=66865 RepID=UPI0037AC9EF3
MPAPPPSAARSRTRCRPGCHAPKCLCRTARSPPGTGTRSGAGCLARPAVRETLSQAQDSLVSWVAQWLATLGSPEPQEYCRVLFDYLDGMMFHQVVLPRAYFDPEAGIRLVLGALLQR